MTVPTWLLRMISKLMTYSVCLIVQVEEYEYDEAMEPSYRASQFKLFNKTLEDGFFPMIVVDAINHKVGWSGQCPCIGFSLGSS